MLRRACFALLLVGIQQVTGFSGWPKGTDGKIGKKFEWMKGTEWDWNNWRTVTFEADGTFVAPTDECTAGECRWSANKGYVNILWGEAGLHQLKASKMAAKKGNKLTGSRVSDGDKCTAQFLRKKQGGEGGQVATTDDEEVDLYNVLGLEQDTATDKDIKKKYRRLSVKYHPDKNQGNAEAAEKFAEVRDAYEILSDPDRKILYDTGGMEAVKGADKEDAGGGQQDPFAMLFGGGRKQKGKKAKKGQDYRMDMDVSLEDMYSGGNVKFSIERRVVCIGCRKKKTAKCAECGKCPHETKMVQRRQGNMIFQQQEKVPSKEKCKNEQTTLEAPIEQGMAAGGKLKFERMSEQRPGQIPGDVIVTVKQKKHARFVRKGDNLHTDMTLSLKEALLGFKKTLSHLDGHEVVVERPPGYITR